MREEPTPYRASNAWAAKIATAKARWEETQAQERAAQEEAEKLEKERDALLAEINREIAPLRLIRGSTWVILTHPSIEDPNKDRCICEVQDMLEALPTIVERSSFAADLARVQAAVYLAEFQKAAKKRNKLRLMRVVWLILLVSLLLSIWKIFAD